MLRVVRAATIFPAEASGGRTACVRDLREDRFAGMAQGACPSDALLFGSLQQVCLPRATGSSRPQNPLQRLRSALGQEGPQERRRRGRRRRSAEQWFHTRLLAGSRLASLLSYIVHFYVSFGTLGFIDSRTFSPVSRRNCSPSLELRALRRRIRKLRRPGTACASNSPRSIMRLSFPASTLLCLLRPLVPPRSPVYTL